MTRPTDIDLDLMRLLHGELPPEEARALRARIDREPELAAAYGRLERSWRGLELPPPAPAPPGFTARVMANLANIRKRPAGLSWSAAPAWVRAAAAAALLTGAALGAGIGSRGLPAGSEPFVEDANEEMAAAGDSLDSLSLAESYWTAFESEDVP